MLYDEATEEWYAQRDPHEVERAERNCMRLTRQFCHHMKEYRVQFFTYVLFQSCRLKRLGKSSPMKKTLTDIDGAQRLHVLLMIYQDKNTDTTFGLFQKQDGQLGMGNKVVLLGANGKALIGDDTEHKLTPGLFVVITNKHPRAGQWKTNDYKVYKSLVAQTMVKSFPNRAVTARPQATWKWKHMLKKMLYLGKG